MNNRWNILCAQLQVGLRFGLARGEVAVASSSPACSAVRLAGSFSLDLFVLPPCSLAPGPASIPHCRLEKHPPPPAQLIAATVSSDPNPARGTTRKCVFYCPALLHNPFQNNQKCTSFTYTYNTSIATTLNMLGFFFLTICSPFKVI